MPSREEIEKKKQTFLEPLRATLKLASDCTYREAVNKPQEEMELCRDKSRSLTVDILSFLNLDTNPKAKTMFYQARKRNY